MKTKLLCILIFAASMAHAVTYPIVDTAQKHAYGKYDGQDAYYVAAKPAYKDNGNGTVSDLVTGLMWTKDPGEKVTYAAAVKNAKTCRVGGYTDWRLPSVKELYSLIQFNGIDPDPNSTETGYLTPFLDNSVFDFKYGDPGKNERVIDSQFATTTIYVSTTMNGNKTMFGVNFADGRIKGYPIGRGGPRGEKTYFALYVRGNSEYGKNKFKDNGNGTITDKATGLTWMQSDSGKGMDWPSALEYAEKMKFAGYTDWRLPSVKELQSIIDYTRSPDTTGSAAIDPLFKATRITNEGGKKDFGQYWTSSTHVSTRSNMSAAYFAFGRSLGWMASRGNSSEKKLLDVHGAGSQRSDPKTGDASRFPYGRGPQGDVVRIKNMVRLVRGGNVKKVNPEVVAEKEQRPSGNNRSSSIHPQGNNTGRQPERGQRRPSHRLEDFDANGDGSITRKEFLGPPHRFQMLDVDSDGVIDVGEIKNAPRPGRRQQDGASGRGRRQGGGDAQPSDASVAARPITFDISPSKSLPFGKPNILFIFADDMGWTGTSVEMIPGDKRTRSDYYQTPNLERLASSGVVFSQAYSPASLCTPTRASVLTGKNPAELHITTPGGARSDTSKKVITPRASNSLPRDLPTIGSVLKQEGYATALLGKWHIGRSDHAGLYGFDFHDGATKNDAQGTDKDPKEIFSLTERGIAFMKKCVESKRPFYLQLSHYAVHSPVKCTAESRERFEKTPKGKIHNKPDYAGMTWDLDKSIGELLKALQELEIAENTYIVFMSDNGAAGGPRKPGNTPLRCGKGTLYEGGIRVPLIIAGAGIEPGSCTEAVTGTDLFATFAALAGAEYSSAESSDLRPLMFWEDDHFNRKQPLLFHFPHYGHGPQQPQSALIANGWKLVKNWEGNAYELFNLSDDLSESQDLSKKNPEKLKEMINLMNRRLASAKAQLPTTNPDYDPAKDKTQKRGPRRRSNA